jgi:hypothetical protein
MADWGCDSHSALLSRYIIVLELPPHCAYIPILYTHFSALQIYVDASLILNYVKVI